MLANKRMFFQDEKGVVLLIGLLVLLALTLLSLTAFLATTTDLKSHQIIKQAKRRFMLPKRESRKPVPASGTMLRKPLKLQMIHLQAQTGSTILEHQTTSLLFLIMTAPTE